jgi:hypothetical protein
VDRGPRRRGVLQPRVLEPRGVDRLVHPGVGILFFFINVWVSHRKGTKAPLDPWDARSLEWLTTSPPKEHNFDRTPTVHALDEVFHRKYEDRGEDGHHDYHRSPPPRSSWPRRKPTPTHIHLPSPSYWPLVLAFSLPIIAYGVIYNTLLAWPAPASWCSRCTAGRSSRRRRPVRLRPRSARGGAELEVATHG